MPFSCVPWPPKRISLLLRVANLKIELMLRIIFGQIYKQGYQFHNYYEDRMRKTSNLMIREQSKKSNRDNSNPTVTNSSFNKSTRLNKQLPTIEQFQLQKEMAKAENLSEHEQIQIQNEARKTVTKKIKKGQTKMENQIISVLQSQCAKLGAELERELMENNRAKVQIQRLRKNISFLNEKLEKAYNDQSHLSKNQIDGKMEKQQLSQELNSLKNLLQRKEDQLDFVKNQKDEQVASLQSQIRSQTQRIEQLTVNGRNLLNEKEELEEELEEKTRQAQYLRENFQQKKKQWQMHRKQFESEHRNNIEKKGQKITKFHVEVQKLQEKLKEEEAIRKKQAEKNKEFEKKLAEQIEVKRNLEEQISTLKKRVNDLSILKSSNNAIMNQKIATLTDENDKLKTEISELKHGSKKNQVKVQKPILFGADDFD